MLTKIQKWGNSLGVRIPQTFAVDAHVKAGSTVDISLEKGALIVRPIRRRRYALSALLEEVTSENLHEEVTTGAPLGREVW